MERISDREESFEYPGLTSLFRFISGHTAMGHLAHLQEKPVDEVDYATFSLVFGTFVGHGGPGATATTTKTMPLSHLLFPIFMSQGPGL